MSKDHISFTDYTINNNKIAWWLVKNNKKFNTRQIYNYFNRVADYGTIIKTIKERKDNVQADSLISEFVECAIFDNKDLSFLPNYVTGRDGVKYYTNTIISMNNRVSAYEVLYGRSPAIVYVNDSHDNGTTSNTTDVTLQKCYNAFGKFNTIDEFLSKIQGKGYAYYYNSEYNTDTTINRIKNRKGVNCTDSSQLTYRVGTGLGYTVQFIHVKCRSSGTGHVRVRLKHSKHTGGEWIYRDPAAVLKGNGVRSNWCMNGTVLAYNPSWIFSDLYQ